MSAQDEFPPGWEYTTPSSEAIAWNAAPKRRRCADDAWWLWTRVSGITREEYTTMRAAAERCKELEAALARVTAERDEVQHYRANANDIATLNYKEAEGLRAELAKVTAQLDEARRMAAVRLNAIESMRRAALRATPTEGE